MKLNDFVIVFAHPDDEILFASSILAKAKKIIICFGDSLEDINVTKGRKSLYSKYPLKNVQFLQINESPTWRRMNYLPFVNPKENEFGLENGSPNLNIYKENFYKLYYILDKLVRNQETIITHNPWGEYGHTEHIQVYKCIEALSKKYKFKVYVTGYTSDLASELMYKSIHKISQSPVISLTDNILFDKIKKLYIKYKCWTWDADYNPPIYEIFYLLKDIQKDPKKTMGAKSLKVSMVPLNLINMRSPTFIKIVLSRIFPKKLMNLILYLKDFLSYLKK